MRQKQQRLDQVDTIVQFEVEAVEPPGSEVGTSFARGRLRRAFRAEEIEVGDDIRVEEPTGRDRTRGYDKTD